MNKVTFNLSKFRKKAYYDDGKGLMQIKTRAMMNCYKSKCEKGMSPQEAFEACLEEYQDSGKSSSWAFKYAKTKNMIKK